MTDIATRWNAGAGTGGWTLSVPAQDLWTDEQGNSITDQNGRAVGSAFTPGTGLELGNDLLTAVLISLFTDAVADPDDVVIDGSGDPRGWWAGPIGSKLWLRQRSRATATLPARVKNDIEQALAWLVEDDVVAAVDVTTEWTKPGLLGAQVVLRRTDGARMALAFSRVWEDL